MKDTYSAYTTEEIDLIFLHSLGVALDPEKYTRVQMNNGTAYGVYKLLAQPSYCLKIIPSCWDFYAY